MEEGHSRILPDVEGIPVHNHFTLLLGDVHLAAGSGDAALAGYDAASGWKSPGVGRPGGNDRRRNRCKQHRQSDQTGDETTV